MIVPPLQVNYKLKYKIITKIGCSNAILKHILQKELLPTVTQSKRK